MSGATIADLESVQQLQSGEQVELLDAIDGLRRERIDADISIPQVVVCGDQSSGKSSVLEAIAQVRFPIGEGTVTRFATEVILRNADTPGLKVELCAARERTPEMRKRIEAFTPDVDVSEPADFPRLVEAASTHLKQLEPQAKFWADWLRATISGPEQPHLTLVDLPGLVQTETGEHVNPGDKERIKALASSYLESPRTTVVAILSATYDKELQEIVGMVKCSPSILERTIGVITKPDLLKQGTDREKAVHRLAANTETPLGLGWHVVRNLEHEDSDRSSAHQREVEEDFFSRGIWSGLAKDAVGVGALRQRLAQGLLTCVSNGLSDLMTDMQRKSRMSRERLDRLGPGRPSVQDQREYLVHIAQKFERLVEASLQSDTGRKEFKSHFADSAQPALRESVSTLQRSFALKIRACGQSRGPDTQAVPFLNSGKLSITQAHEYCKEISDLMSRKRGTLLPGETPPGMVSTIFRLQSARWDDMACNHADSCRNAVYGFLKQVTVHIAGQTTGEKLLGHYIYRAIDERAERLSAKVTELLWPYRKCHPQTSNPQYLHTIQSRDARAATSIASKDGDAEADASSWLELAQDEHWDAELLEAADVLDRAESFYTIALNTFIDNLSTLAVEACLLDGLAEIIPVDHIATLPEITISDLAAEPSQVVTEREKLQAQIKALNEAMRICRRHVRDTHRSALPQRNGSSPPSQERRRAQPAASPSSNFSNGATPTASNGTAPLFSQTGVFGGGSTTGVNGTKSSTSNSGGLFGSSRVPPSTASPFAQQSDPAESGRKIFGAGDTPGFGSGGSPFGNKSGGSSGKWKPPGTGTPSR